MKLSDLHAFLAKAASDRAWADYNAYVRELQDRQDGKLIDGTCREVRTTELHTIKVLDVLGKPTY